MSCHLRPPAHTHTHARTRTQAHIWKAAFPFLALPLEVFQPLCSWRLPHLLPEVPAVPCCPGHSRGCVQICKQRQLARVCRLAPLIAHTPEKKEMMALSEENKNISSISPTSMQNRPLLGTPRNGQRWDSHGKKATAPGEMRPTDQDGPLPGSLRTDH